MVAIAKDYSRSELQFNEYYGVMQFDPASIDFDSKWSTIADTKLFVVNGKWMFGELTVSYPISFFADNRGIIEHVKQFYFFMDGDHPRIGITTDLQIAEHADKWELKITFVNVSSMLV